MPPTKVLARRPSPPISPNNFVPEVATPEDGVQQRFDIGMGRVVYVEIEASSRLEDPVHFDQSDT